MTSAPPTPQTPPQISCPQCGHTLPLLVTTPVTTVLSCPLTCPQCQHQVVVVIPPTVAAPPPAADTPASVTTSTITPPPADEADAPPAIPPARALLTWLLAHTPLRLPEPAALSSRRMTLSRIGLILVGVLLLVLIWGRWVAWGAPAEAPAATATVTSTPPPPTPVAGSVEATTQAALVELISQYQAAEAKTSATLELRYLQPYLDPAGALAQRRAQQVQQRQAQQAPHETRVVSWTLGGVQVQDGTATVVAQETWSNQELDEAAPQTATVRVIYTLRYEAAARRWLLVDAVQQRL